MSRWAWLATFAIGCGHPTTSASTTPGPHVAVADAGVDAPIALDRDPARLAARSVQLFLDWQRALAEAGTDCAAATARINAVVDANADVIAANQRVLRGDRAGVTALRAELDKRAAEMDPAAKAISQSPTMAKCSSDPAFGKAIDRLQGDG